MSNYSSRIFLNDKEITKDIFLLEYVAEYLGSYEICFNTRIENKCDIIEKLFSPEDRLNKLEIKDYYGNNDKNKYCGSTYYAFSTNYFTTTMKGNKIFIICWKISEDQFKKDLFMDDFYRNRIEELESKNKELIKEIVDLKNHKTEENKDINIEDVFLEFYPKFLFGGTLFFMFVFFVVLPLKFLLTVLLGV